MSLAQKSSLRSRKSIEFNEKRETLMKKYEPKLTSKLMLLKEISMNLENSNNELRVKCEKSLEKKTNLRIQKSIDLNEKKKILREQLEKNFIEESKNPPQNYPKQLKPYWMRKDWEALSPTLNAKKQAIRGHVSFLTRGLGKMDKSLEWFLETYKDEIAIVEGLN